MVNGRFIRRDGLKTDQTISLTEPYVALKCNRCREWVHVWFEWTDEIPRFARQPLCTKCKNATLREALGWRGRVLLAWKRLFRTKKEPKNLLSSGPYR